MLAVLLKSKSRCLAPKSIPIVNATVKESKLPPRDEFSGSVSNTIWKLPNYLERTLREVEFSMNRF